MSSWINIKRVARYGLIGFIRNGFVSLAAVLVMLVTLFFIANLMISNGAMRATLQELTEQVDVTIYFLTTAPEEEILTLKQSLEALPEVEAVIYETREQALATFRERHKNDQLTLQALDELSENPLSASLSVRAKETSQYESVANYLEAQRGSGTGPGASIERVNFTQNKIAIDRLTDVINTSERNGLVKGIVLALSVLLISFNTIRLAIYTARDEISVMNLVGAGQWYVRGPFLMAGALYGIVSALLVLLLLFPILYFYPVLVGLDATSELLFGNFDSFAYFSGNFFIFFGVLMGLGVTLGVLSSYLAVRRYLRA